MRLREGVKVGSVRGFLNQRLDSILHVTAVLILLLLIGPKLLNNDLTDSSLLLLHKVSRSRHSGNGSQSHSAGPPPAVVLIGSAESHSLPDGHLVSAPVHV